MKKLALTLIFVLLVVSCVFMLSSCDAIFGTEPPADGTHEHKYSEEWSSDATSHYHICECGEKSEIAEHTWVDATCTSAKTCSVCGAIEGNALAHTPEIIKGKDPTCTETGLTDGTRCSVCQFVFAEQEVIPALGHKDAKLVPAVPVTHTTNGSREYYHCDACDSNLEGKDATAEVLTDEEIIILAMGHTRAELVAGTPATHTENGTRDYYYCAECDAKFEGRAPEAAELTDEELVLLATGHIRAELVEAVPATHTENGTAAYYYCADCDAKFESRDPAAAQLTDEDLVILAMGHTYAELVPAVPATHTTNGTAVHYYCATCDANFEGRAPEAAQLTEEDLVILAMGHTYAELVPAVPATHTENGTAAYYYCAECDAKFEGRAPEAAELTEEDLVILAMGHTYAELVPAVPASCTATGTIAYYYCAECDAKFEGRAPEAKQYTDDEIVAPALGHADVDTDYKCDVCGADLSANCPHENTTVAGTAVEATHKTPGLTAGIKCIDCGKVTEEPIATPALGHTTATYVAAKPATHTENGNWEHYFCEECGEYYDTTAADAEALPEEEFVINAQGHMRAELVAGTPATHTENGTRDYYYCADCDAKFEGRAPEAAELTEEDLVILAMGHTYAELVTGTPATHTENGTRDYYYCAECDAKFEGRAPEAAELTEDDLVILAMGHTYAELVPAVPATHTTNGTAVHYYCAECDANFEGRAPEAAELTEDDLVILAMGHTYAELVPAVPATCTEAGTIEHYYCAECDANFEGRAPEAKQYTDEEIVVDPIGHSYTGAPVWTSSKGTYTATYACDNAGCNVPKTVTISIPSAEGVDSIVHTEDNSAFKFEITLAERYLLISVKIGDQTLEAVDGVYSAPIEDSEIVIVTEAIPVHTVTFYNWDGKTVLETVEVEHGKLPVYSGEALPAEIWKEFSRAALSANVWNKELSAVTEDTEYVAVYEELYTFEIYEMSGDTVSPHSPTWAGPNFEFAVSTRANIQKADKFKVTLTSTATPANADYRDHDSISFYFRVNYDGITFSTTDGTVFLTAVKNTTYQLAVDKTGKVYINGILLDGIVMSDGVVEFDITINPETDTYAYFEVTDIVYDVDVEIKSEFVSQLKDMYNAAGANGTKSVAAATNEEKLSYGVTQFTTFTAGGWQEQPFDNFDLTPYEIVKFYAQRLGGGSIKVAGLTFYCDPNVTEFKFVKNGASYDLYVAGVKQNLGDTVLTNLNQIKFNIGSAGQSFRYSDVIIDFDSYVPEIPEKSFTLTIGNDGAISGEGVTGQTIVLPSARVWNINEANALTVTVALTDAEALAGALSINGVAIGVNETTVKINNALYLVGGVDYSVAGQVSFKIAYIQDQFYWNTDATVSFKNLVEDNGAYTVGSQYNLTEKADSKITAEEGVAAYHANSQKINGTWYDNWRLTLNKSGMDSISFYMTFNYNGGQLYAKDGIGDPTKLIHTFTANEVILVTIQRDGSVLINGVDSGVDTSSDSFALDFYNGGSENAYGSIGISQYYWRYNNI